MQVKDTYLIGEIGQNHNGSIDIAKLIVDLAARPVREDAFGGTYHGLDAIKLTKRDLNQELSRSQMSAPYESPHSFGKTYREHREALELTDEEHCEMFHYARAAGLEFIETICAIGCLSLLELFVPDYIKVASRDLTNLPLLVELGRTRVPLILSTGMAGREELDRALDVLTPHHDQISILHCVSEYPTRPENVNLHTISYLREQYPNFRIGYSDHTIGIATPVAAVALGAQIIEKHITIDRRMKGSDQAGSLGPDGVHRMVRDIRLLDRSLGTKTLFVSPSTAECRRKLERSIATNRAIRAGEVINEADIHLLSPGDGIPWHLRSEVIGRAAKKDLDSNTTIYHTDLDNPTPPSSL